MLKTASLVFLYVLCGAVGNLMVGWGMKQKVMHMPLVASGTLILTLGYAVYLGLLKEVPLSVVVPAGAASYILIAAISRLVLNESVPVLRWVGAIVVSLGVSIVMISDWQSRAAQAAEAESPPAQVQAQSSRATIASAATAPTR
jgi:uncharacterized membrane protein